MILLPPLIPPNKKREGSKMTEFQEQSSMGFQEHSSMGFQEQSSMGFQVQSAVDFQMCKRCGKPTPLGLYSPQVISEELSNFLGALQCNRLGASYKILFGFIEALS